jgi:hypothetical protein
MLAVYPNSEERWVVCCLTDRFAYQNEASNQEGLLIVPNHGSSEVGKGLELRLRKLAGLN